MMKKEDNDVHAVTLQHQALPTELLTCLVILISRVSAVRDRFESVATYNAKVQQQINSDKQTCLYIRSGIQTKMPPIRTRAQRKNKIEHESNTATSEGTMRSR